MQSVSAAFTAEEKDVTRKIAHNLQVSWKRFSTLSNRTFTIGVSTIGGNDIIGINPGAIGSPGNYKYFDESAYVTQLAWERGYNMPTGGLSKALAEAELDNTSGRFTPRYMGGNSELFTAILPRRPLIINAGFNFGGVDNVIPQFAGIISEPPEVDTREKKVSLKATDYIDYFQNKFLDQSVMFTGQRTDQVLTTLSNLLGMSTAQYDYDYGVNIIPFGYFPVGSKFSEVVNDLVEAELGHYYQNEEGKFIFENRQHWDSAPFNSVQKLILTSQVINAEAPNTDHLINVVEVSGGVRKKQPLQIIFTLSTPLPLNPSGDNELFINFDDPILEIITPTSADWTANLAEDGSSTNTTTQLTLRYIDKFAQATKLTFHNSNTTGGFLTSLVLHGRPAKVAYDLYYRAQRDASVTAYSEQPITIDNDFISDPTWAKTLSQMVLNDFAFPENLQRITIRAIPELQLGDLISWQGRYWRVFDIKSTLDPSVGFLQELLLLQRTITSYFRIGISTIGGTDKISP